MTESEWLTCADPVRMLDLVTQNTDHQGFDCISQRKVVKIACAARRATGGYSWARMVGGWTEWDCDEIGSFENDDWPAVRYAKLFLDRYAPSTERSVEAGPDIIRDIVGNPFRPVTVCGLSRKPFHNQYAHVDTNGGFWLEQECPACKPILTPTVLGLATAAYDTRQPDGTLDPLRLSVLADALEEAGCETHDGVCPECNGSGELGTLGGRIGCYICAPDYKTRGTGRSNRRMLRCECGGNYIIVRKKSFPVPLSSCQKCRADGPLWEDVVRGEVLPHPILAHLRSPGTHWRGCHIVDLILGKE